MNLKWMATTVAVGILSIGAGAQTPPATNNTKVNQRDKNKMEATADQAKNNANDREVHAEDSQVGDGRKIAVDLRA